VSKFRVSLINGKEFSKWLDKLGKGRVEKAVNRYLNEQCTEMVEDIKKTLGSYQPARGPFPAWPALSPYTLAGKKSDTPLVEDMELWASVLYIDLGPTKKLIGATKPGASWHEYGLPLRTPPLPARPFVRPVIWMRVESMKMGIRKALVEELREGGGRFIR
jgi:hypothetical protein